MNKIIIIGNLTKDPELRATPKGTSVCTMTVAVNRRWSQDGEKLTDYFAVTAWRELGEQCAKYLNKGRKVAVWGELQPRTYESKDGQTRTSLDVVAETIEFLNSAKENEKKDEKPVSMEDFIPVNSDDIPF